jgi:hypothetical protein
MLRFAAGSFFRVFRRSVYNSRRDGLFDGQEGAGFDGAGDTSFELVGCDFEIVIGLQVEPPTESSFSNTRPQFLTWPPP